MPKLFRGRYSQADNKRVRELTRVRNDEPSKTIQSATADCDLNVLVKRFGIDKEPVPYAAADPRFYGDFSDVPDLATALQRVRSAEQLFNDLPARIRDYFRNDPAMMWQWVNDPQNADEAVSMGLLARTPAANPEPTPNPSGIAPAAPASP